jgi:hypothetical protein
MSGNPGPSHERAAAMIDEDDARLQDLVDGLAARLHRSVAVDDPSIRLIVASRHFGDEDQVRIQSILSRDIDDELKQLLLATGIRQITKPTRIDLPREGHKPRVCIPVRCSDLLMGFLVLIDDRMFTDDEIVDASEVADQIGLRLYRREVALDRRRARLEILLRGLLSSDADARGDALRELHEEELLRDTAQVAVAVVSSPSFDDDTPPEQLPAVLALAADHLLRSQPEGSTLVWVRRASLVVLVAQRASRASGIEHLAAKTVADAAAATEKRWIAGIGTVSSGLQHADQAYEQAVIAGRAAEHLPELGDVVTWESLGVYGLLAQLAPRDLSLTSYPAALLRLAGQRGARQLLVTAETYLDSAGDAKRAAAALHIHRGTLYQRLARIEQLSGLDLNNGMDRLTLHLGIKLARLADTYDQLTRSPAGNSGTPTPASKQT